MKQDTDPNARYCCTLVCVHATHPPRRLYLPGSTAVPPFSRKYRRTALYEYEGANKTNELERYRRIATRPNLDNMPYHSYTRERIQQHSTYPVSSLLPRRANNPSARCWWEWGPYTGSCSRNRKPCKPSCAAAPRFQRDLTVRMIELSCP